MSIKASSGRMHQGDDMSAEKHWTTSTKQLKRWQDEGNRPCRAVVRCAASGK